MRLLDEHLHQFARCGVVLAELAVVLVAVQFDEEERLLVGCPRDVGEVAVGGVARIQVDGLAVGRVVDAHLHLVARHAGHGVADVVHLTHTCGDVYQRISGHHRLVHAVEGQQVACGAPEGTFRDAELVAVNALSADDAFGFVGHLLVVHVEVVFQGVGHVSACHGIVRVGGLLVKSQDIGSLSCLPVVGDVSAGQGDEEFRLVFPRQLYVVEVRQLAQLFGFECLVDAFTGREQCFLAVLGVDGHEGVDARLDALVAPPLQAVEALGVAVGCSAGDEVFQRGVFQFVRCSFLCHNGCS